MQCSSSSDAAPLRNLRTPRQHTPEPHLASPLSPTAESLLCLAFLSMLCTTHADCSCMPLPVAGVAIEETR